MSVRSRVVLSGCVVAGLLIGILRLTGYGNERAWGDEGPESAGVAKAWAVGGGGTILHYDGKAWKSVTSGVETAVRAVSGTGPKDVWALGGSGVIHWNGSAWSNVAIDVPHYGLYALFARTPSDVWVGGDAGVTIHFDGRKWTKHALADDAAMLVYQLQATGPDDVWGIGGSGVRVIRWDGERWKDDGYWASRSRGTLWADAPNDAWLVHTGTVFRSNGTEWSREGTDARPPSASLLRYGPDELWACGGARVMRRVKGVWEDMDLPPIDSYSEALLAMTRARNGDAWAVGTRGMILHYERGAWRRDVSGTEQSLAGVWAY
jgi:hypothetical protein